jgi:hypothetical protein
MYNICFSQCGLFHFFKKLFLAVLFVLGIFKITIGLGLASNFDPPDSAS